MVIVMVYGIILWCGVFALVMLGGYLCSVVVCFYAVVMMSYMV